jgi:fatty acid desaturase
VAPLNVNYHLTHHVFPSVPFYNLPHMHKELAKTGLLEDGVNRFDSYLGTTNSIRQFITRERQPSTTVAAASQQELSQPLQS